MGIFVLSRDIRPNEELLLSYGKAFWRARGLLLGEMESEVGAPDVGDVVDGIDVVDANV